MNGVSQQDYKAARAAALFLNLTPEHTANAKRLLIHAENLVRALKRANQLT